MVSSKWVDGLSKGIFPVSAITIIKNPKNENNKLVDINTDDSAACDTIVSIFVAPYVTATINKTKNSAGSIKDEIIISLLTPIPPKALETSSPASIKKNLETPNR